MARGTLRIYLGAAPGVGKTFAMLNEGKRRLQRGTDVVVAYVETHDRPQTVAQLEGLECIPRRDVSYRGSTLEEMDVAAVIARRPSVALVDELAHTNAPGSGHDKRWQDVDDLRDAGIDVITTLNVQHLESVNDVVEQITGIKQRETIPDAVARSADQVELVDMAPEALRRRMAHGNIYAAEKVDAALGNYFRIGNLSALRELALMWVADNVDDALQGYKAQHGINDTWETRERVVVALTGSHHGEQLIRRAARMAMRSRGDLLGLHVLAADGLAAGTQDLLVGHRQLLEDLGGEYREVAGDDVARTLTRVARSEQATQLVLGATGRSRWAELTRGSIVNEVLRHAGSLDVHVISVDIADMTPVVARPSLPALPRRRQLLGWAIGAAGIPLLTVALANLRGDLGLPSQLLLYLLLLVGVAAVGGIGPAVATALAGSLCTNWFFTPPYYRFDIARGENALALVIFLSVGSLVSLLVTQAARRADEVARARADAVIHAEGDALRTSLLRAVSHDLRSPLVSIKASVTSLEQDDIEWPKDAVDAFLDTIHVEVDRLDLLVANLLDMSRLESGGLRFQLRPVGYEEAVPAVLRSLSGPTECVDVAIDDTLPRVTADPALLERVIANLTSNAINASPEGGQVRIEAGRVAGRVDLRIIDRGHGIPPADRERMFEPFQRLGDGGGNGVGLGLAVASGFVDAMGGELAVEDTPGGGITMVVGLPEATEA